MSLQDLLIKNETLKKQVRALQEKVKELELKNQKQSKGHQHLLGRISRTSPRKVLIIPHKRQIISKCHWCLNRFPRMPQDSGCWASSREMINLVTDLTEHDLKVAKYRLSVEGEAPQTLGDCNNAQKRVIVYYKIYKHFWKVKGKGVRKQYSKCLLSKVREIYPDITN